MSNVVMTFLAHPDDAEVTCTGTLARLAGLGWEVHIVTATGGDLGSVDELPEQAAATRRGEAARAAAVIGATYHCLGLRDGRVTYCVEALDRAYDLFRRIGPKLVITHPRIDYHRDHEETHQIGRAASFVYAAPHAAASPLRAGSGVPHLYYIHPLITDTAIGQLPPVTTAIDVRGQMEVRKRMLACHVSQQKWIEHHHKNADFFGEVERRAARAGAPYGCPAAEVFIQHRVRPYPANDVLGELLGNLVK